MRKTAVTFLNRHGRHGLRSLPSWREVHPEGAKQADEHRKALHRQEIEALFFFGLLGLHSLHSLHSLRSLPSWRELHPEEAKQADEHRKALHRRK